MSRKMMWTTVITAVVVAALIAMVFVSGRKSATPPEEQKGTELVEMVPAKGDGRICGRESTGSGRDRSGFFRSV